MLIGIDASRAVPSERTGTEQYSLHLIRALVRLGKEAHHFRLYFNQPPPKGLFERNERVEWRIIPFPRLWSHLRLAWEIHRRPPDVLFIPAHVLPLLHPSRCVVTIHDLGFLYYPETHPPLARWYLCWATRFNARHAQRVIVDSKATRDDLIAFYHLEPQKIVVAYPSGAEGFTPVKDPLRLAQVRRRYHTGESYFLYVGSLHPRKNILTLLEAFARLHKYAIIRKDTKLVLVGKRGWLYQEIFRRAQEDDLAGKVSFPGYVSTEDLAALFSGAVAFVFPSLYEGFGLPILEAMACEVPVISSNTSSLPEVVGDAGLLVDPHNVKELCEAMARLYHDPVLRNELISRGKRRRRLFSWEACAHQVLSTLEAVGGFANAT